MTTETESASYLTEPDNKHLDHIPGHYGSVPYIGNTIELFNDLYGFIDKNYKQYGEVSKIKLVGQPSLLVVGADNYQHIYLDPEKAFSAQMGYDSSIGNFYEGALLLRDFKDHKIQRRLFQTAFKNDQMRGYVDIINPLFQQSITTWQEQKNFKFFPAAKKSLLDVGASVFIGVKEFGSEMDKLNNAFLDISEKGLMSLLRLNIPGLKFHKGKQGAKYLENYFRRIIPIRRAGDGKDMLTYLCKEKLQTGEYYLDSDIIPQASFLLFAAHDTTASTLNTLMLKLAEMPDWQNKLREEALSLNKPMLDYDDLDKLELSELVFKEVLRMIPPTSMLQRRTIKETTLGGLTIPPNTVISVPPVYNHYMPEFWTNPEQFDPYRFAEGREEHKRHSFCYMPFGGGAHKCIGMHFANMIVKCFLHQFLLTYEWSLPEGFKPQHEDFPLPKTKDGLPILLKVRR